MGKTILCPHCKSTFDENILKKKNSMDKCPVCEKSLLSGSDYGQYQNISFGNGIKLGENDSFDEDKIDFWWYEIDEPDVNSSTSGRVYTTCAKCGYLSCAPYYIARNGNYLLIGSRFNGKCSCGNQMKNHILSKRPSDWVDPRKRDIQTSDYLNIPKCPTCSSTDIKKISAASKVGSVVMWGLLSRKVHKQWHCNTCGSEW